MNFFNRRNSPQQNRGESRRFGGNNQPNNQNTNSQNKPGFKSRNPNNLQRRNFPNKNQSSNQTFNREQSPNKKSFSNKRNRFGGQRDRGRGQYSNPNVNRNNLQPKQSRNEIYPTANALNWGNNNSYQFRAEEGVEKLKIIPVSGVEMVGTNCTLLEYQNDIMIIDAGVGFPGEMLLGVDALVPNLEYLYDKKDKIRGLVITHGHTDHIGAIHHIIDKIGFPMIYAPRLAAELIREKLKETPYANQVKITEIDGDSSYYLGKFHISHFKMTHTIPDNYGIVIDTPVGRVVTTSDYKFDISPYKESPSDYSKLSKLGDEGVLLLLDESTNAKKKGWSESETDIAKDIEDIIRDANGRVLIGMFSTMVNRIRQVVEIADRHNKKVAVLGRSLETIVKVTHRLGYINVLNNIFVPFDEVTNIPDNQLVIITTGSQGEPNAALMRMANDEHQKVTLKPSDTVVFSSSRIPGNEGKIDRLINLITQKGCKVLTNDYLTLHATGHGHKKDHKLMLQLVKPKFFMPIHGEPSMLRAHKDTAIEQGYVEQNIIMPSNGAVIEVWKDGWQINEKIETTPLWVEGNRVGDFDPEVIEERKMLMDEGVVVVSIKNFNSESLSVNDLEITHKGFFVQRSDEFIKRGLVTSVVERIKQMPDKEKELVRSAVRKQVENELVRQYEKRPVVVVSVM